MVSPIKEKGIGLAFFCLTSGGNLRWEARTKPRKTQKVKMKEAGGDQKEREPLADV